MKKWVFAVGMAFALTLAVVAVAGANGQTTCPPTGDGWTKIDSADLSLYPVTGATDYCFKAGSDKSEGCEGGLFDGQTDPHIFGTTVGDVKYCGLSHWSYKVEVTPLNLTFMQPCQPAEGTPANAEWRVRNPNNFPVTYDVWKSGTGTILTGQVAPPGDSFFYTPWGAQTLKIVWNGGEKTKAGGNTYNGTLCPPPPPKSVAGGTLVADCTGNSFTVFHSTLYLDAPPIDGIYTVHAANGGTGPHIGEWAFYWEADKGWAFPEGFVTEGTFVNTTCDEPEEHPETGPASIPAWALGVAGIAGAVSLGAAVRLRRRR